MSKVLAATPVVMTVIATMLAGLSSSEMTHAQYDRSLAAQQQSKAGDQWSFFQAKRLRGALQRIALPHFDTHPRSASRPRIAAPRAASLFAKVLLSLQLSRAADGGPSAIRWKCDDAPASHRCCF